MVPLVAAAANCTEKVWARNASFYLIQGIILAAALCTAPVGKGISVISTNKLGQGVEGGEPNLI